MNILLLEPFYSGSHQQWAEGLQKHSKHNVQILSLPGRHWKWRMHGGAVSLAKKFNELEESPDLILATSMLDLTTLLSLTRKRSANIPVAIYFHENQLTYPWSPQDRDVKKKRNNHYSFINYASALAADKVFFNSKYHMDSFLGALPKFLKQFPDKRERDNIEVTKEKSEVLHLGLDLKRFEDFRSSDKEKQSEATILWNHRWEYDKNPEEFFETLFEVKKKEIGFKLVVLGEQNDVNPPIFDEAKEKLKDEILHWGYADSFDDYAKWLWRADILPVTSNQDFFGGSVIEAMYCDCFPLLPNRLAYPEHLPEELDREFLYEEGELPARLETAIESVMGIRQVDYQSIAKKYDWKELVEKYDEKMEKLY
jgi:glycosyltransferase involved in cell wall biosynthesis